MFWLGNSKNSGSCRSQINNPKIYSNSFFNWQPDVPTSQRPLWLADDLFLFAAHEGKQYNAVNSFPWIERSRSDLRGTGERFARTSRFYKQRLNVGASSWTSPREPKYTLWRRVTSFKEWRLNRLQHGPEDCYGYSIGAVFESLVAIESLPNRWNKDCCRSRIMGSAGSLVVRKKVIDDEEFSEKFESGVTKEIPIEIENPPAPQTTSIKSVGSFGIGRRKSRKNTGDKPVTKSISLRSALSIEPDVELKHKTMQIAELEVCKDNLQSENQRLRGEIKALQATCIKLRNERGMALEGKDQALQRATAFEKGEYKQCCVKVFFKCMAWIYCSQISWC